MRCMTGGVSLFTRPRRRIEDTENLAMARSRGGEAVRKGTIELEWPWVIKDLGISYTALHMKTPTSGISLAG